MMSDERVSHDELLLSIETLEATKQNVVGDFDESNGNNKEQALQILRGHLQAMASC